MHLLLLLPDGRERAELRKALQERPDLGISALTDGDDIERFADAIAAREFDLVVTDLERAPRIRDSDVPVVSGDGDLIDAVARAARTWVPYRRLAYTVQHIFLTIAADGDLSAMTREITKRARVDAGASFALLRCELSRAGHGEELFAAAGPTELDDEALALLHRAPLLRESIRAPEREVLEPGAVPAEIVDLTGPISSMVTVPVESNDHSLRGYFLFAHPLPTGLGDEHISRGVALASLAAAAIVNAHSRRELDRAIRVREQILAVASHDLRNPLSVFNMALDLIEDSQPGELRLDVIARARRSIDRMRRLVSDILDFAAIDAGTLRVEVGPVNPSSIAAGALESVSAEAAKKHIEIRVTGYGGDRRVQVDRGRIVQALTNLMTNAIKFTPREGVVTLEVVDDGADTVFSVADTGPGIPAEEQSRLFDRYYTGSRGKKSVGLGLPIARGIAEAHEGQLTVESIPDRGATFFLRLPAAGPAPVAGDPNR
jgi:signal transduction histidine kinase